jgi:hypothetical protein
VSRPISDAHQSVHDRDRPGDHADLEGVEDGCCRADLLCLGSEDVARALVAEGRRDHTHRCLIKGDAPPCGGEMISSGCRPLRSAQYNRQRWLLGL